MPLFLIGPELQSGQLVVALDHRVKSQSHYYLVAPDGRPGSMPLKAFSDWLLQEVADFSGRSPEPE